MQKIALKYGIQMFLSLAILFALVHISGLSQNYNLRVLNGFFHFAFLFLAIKEYRKQAPETINNYISGVAMGMYMSMVAVILFAVGLIIYLNIDHSFFSLLKNNFPYPEIFSPVVASLVIVAEGIAVSLIGGYIVTRFIDGLLDERNK